MNAPNQNFLRKVIDKLPGNVWWKDQNLIYLGCNESVIQMLGLTSEKEFVGKADHDLWPKTIADKLREADLHVLRTGETINLEETILHGDGRQAIMLTNKSPLRDDAGQIIGIVGTSTNISDRKQTKLALKKAKEDLAEKVKTESETRAAVRAALCMIYEPPWVLSICLMRH